MKTTRHQNLLAYALAFITISLLLPCLGQDIEPRRWSHLPIGSNFLGGACAYTTGDIFLDPVLKIEDGEFDLQTIAAKYIRSFDLLGKSARVDITQAYQSGEWTGVLNGTPASVNRSGWSDTFLRFAVNLKNGTTLSYSARGRTVDVCAELAP